MEHKKKLELIDKLSSKLVTHDMRYTFCILFFPSRMVSMTRLEGTADEGCHQLVFEAEKRGLFNELKDGVQRLFPNEDFEYIKA